MEVVVVRSITRNVTDMAELCLDVAARDDRTSVWSFPSHKRCNERKNHTPDDTRN